MAVIAENAIGEFSLIWRIENFSYCLQRADESIKSPKFMFYQSIYYLQLFLTREDDHVVCRPIGLICQFRQEVSIYIADVDLLNPSKTENNSIKRYSWIGLDKLPHLKLLSLKGNSLIPNDTLVIGLNFWDGAIKLAPVGSRIVHTRIGIESSSFVWVVKGFSDLSLQERSYTFQSFSEHPEMTMKLSLEGLSNEESIQIEIKQVGATRCNLVVCKISLLNVRGDATKSMKQERRFEVSTGEQIWKFPSFISKRTLMSDKDMLLANGMLSLHFEFVTSIGIVSNWFEKEHIIYLPPPTKSISINEIKRNPSNLKGDLFDFYEQKKLCDATLQVGNIKFPVHKSIICARSPVFLAMFERDMAENRTGIADIPDLEADIVERMVLFLYTDTVQGLNFDSASKLYFAADKYRILSLREECSAFMNSHLDSSNVLHVLILADRHLDEDLKWSCQQFIYDSGKEIVTSEEWKTFEKNNAVLAFDTFRCLYLKKLEF